MTELIVFSGFSIEIPKYLIPFIRWEEEKRMLRIGLSMPFRKFIKKMRLEDEVMKKNDFRRLKGFSRKEKLEIVHQEVERRLKEDYRRF